MKTILVSAYACDPSKGSEDSYGYHWALGLSNKGFNVICITRKRGKEEIEKSKFSKNLNFVFIDLPFPLESLYYLSRPTMYLHYLLWQWFAYRKAKNLNKVFKFDLVHHVTWGSLQLGSFMYRLRIPLIFGPAGGGQDAPVAFKSYFKEYWKIEQKRKWIGNLLVKYNPACKNMLRTAKAVLLANNETKNLAIKLGATNYSLLLDVSLDQSFYPTKLPEHNFNTDLRILWIGRLLPRKGILLVTELMSCLKAYDDISLTIVGDGEMRKYLEQEIVIKNLTNINYVGAVEYSKVKEFYRSHNLFIFTSLRDSGGVQLLEAMAYGLPVVGLKLHGQDVILNEDTAIKCPAIEPLDTINALKEAVLNLYTDRLKLKKMSRAAFNYAKKRTWDNQIDEVVNQYY